MVGKQNLLEWASVPRSTYDYKHGNGKGSRKLSTLTVTPDGELVDKSVVLQEAETILQQKFCYYGYKNVWDALKEQGYIINHKKVYRLMKIHNLLFNRRIGSTGLPRQFVCFRKKRAEKLLEDLCMIIKSSMYTSIVPSAMHCS